MSALCAALLALGALDAGAELHPTDVVTRVEPQTLRLGDQFVYELKLTHPKADRYELQLPKELGAFELISQERSREDVPGTELSATTFHLRFAAFELGPLEVPQLLFDVVGPDAVGSYRAPRSVVQVAATLSEEAVQKGEGLYDIREPADVPVPSYRLVWIALGATAAALAAYLLYRRFKRRGAPKAAPPKPPEPADVRAMAALGALLLANLHGQRRFREFHFRLSEILRGYLGERFGFDALECTSQELMDALSRRFTPGLQREALARLVLQSDLVKFARGDTTPEACAQQLDFARQVIQSTTAAMAPPTGTDRAARAVP